MMKERFLYRGAGSQNMKYILHPG